MSLLVFLDLSREDDSDDESIDCDSLAENDWDQVLGLDPGGLDSSAYDGSSSCVDSKGGSDHTEIESEVVENTIIFSVTALYYVKRHLIQWNTGAPK